MCHHDVPAHRYAVSRRFPTFSALRSRRIRFACFRASVNVYRRLPHCGHGSVRGTRYTSRSATNPAI